MFTPASSGTHHFALVRTVKGEFDVRTRVTTSNTPDLYASEKQGA